MKSKTCLLKNNTLKGYCTQPLWLKTKSRLTKQTQKKYLSEQSVLLFRFKVKQIYVWKGKSSIKKTHSMVIFGIPDWRKQELKKRKKKH